MKIRNFDKNVKNLFSRRLMKATFSSGVFVVLEREYNSREKVAELIDGGDMSSCFSDSEYDDDQNKFIEREPRPTYYAERGEDCPPRIDNNINEYLDNGEEFAYIFDLDNKWICYDRHEFDDDKNPEIVPIPANHPE